MPTEDELRGPVLEVGRYRAQCLCPSKQSRLPHPRALPPKCVLSFDALARALPVTRPLEIGWQAGTHPRFQFVAMPTKFCLRNSSQSEALCTVEPATVEAVMWTRALVGATAMFIVSSSVSFGQPTQ